jgi:hypothetical protein
MQLFAEEITVHFEVSIHIAAQLTWPSGKSQDVDLTTRKTFLKY